MLPDRWFGYDAVDVPLLPGGNRDFLLTLLGDKTQRKQALAEWVRRGGRLIVSEGFDQDAMAKLLEGLFPKAAPAGPPDQGFLAGRAAARPGCWVPKQPQPFMNPPLANQGSQVPPLDIARLEGKAGQPWEVLGSRKPRKTRLIPS